MPYGAAGLRPEQQHVPAKMRFFVEYLKGIYSAPDYWTKAS